MLLRRAVNWEPEEYPNQADKPGDNESPLPAVVNRDRRRDQRRDNRADIRAGIENTGRERTLLLGKPLRDGFDGGWKVSRFADAEREAGRSELRAVACKRMCGRRQRP